MSEIRRIAAILVCGRGRPQTQREAHRQIHVRPLFKNSSGPPKARARRGCRGTERGRSVHTLRAIPRFDDARLNSLHA